MNAPCNVFDIEFSEDKTNKGQGWCCGTPVGIKTTQWPRSRVNGLPMAHIFTFAVPSDYRTKGDQYVAISLFHADDHVADVVDGVMEALAEGTIPKDKDATVFWEGIQEYVAQKHPMEIYLEDEIDGGWALIWLTNEEFNGTLTELPDEEASTYPDYDSFDGTSAFSQNTESEYIELIERKDDPNTGKAISGYPDKAEPDAYIRMYSDKGEELGLDKFHGKTHFGGTSSPCQGEPDYSAFYLEFDEMFGGANLGGDGVAQIDLLNDKLTWSCG